MKRIYFLGMVLAFFSTLLFAVPEKGTVFVKVDGDDQNDGTSWTTAVASIAKGADLAKAAQKDVWIAAGSYTVQSLALSNYPGVGFYGGFQGVEGETVEGRVMRTDDVKPWNYVNETIIDGNQGVIFTIAGGAPAVTIVVDGITIRNGKGSSAAPLGVVRANYTIRNCRIMNNTNTGSGGALAAWGSPEGGDTYIQNCYFYNNRIVDETATGNLMGGAIHLNLNSANWRFHIDNCTFEKSSAPGASARGGAIRKHNSGQVLISNSTFYDNSIGGGNGSALLYDGGAADQVINSLFYNNMGGSSIVVTNDTYLCNNTIVNNTGAMFVIGKAGESMQVKVYNSIVVGNQSGITGAPSFFVENSVLDQSLPLAVNGKNNSTLALSAVDFRGPTNFQGSSNGDPEKVAQLRAANFALFPASGAINKGENSFFTNSEWGKLNSTDIVGRPRIQFGRIDVGAYENQYQSMIYVSPNGQDSYDGSTWQNAKKTILGALAEAGQLRLKTIYFAKGSYDMVNVPHFQNYPGFSFYGGFSGEDDQETPATRSRVEGGETWDFANRSIWRGNGSAPLFTMAWNASATILIDGMTIENGAADEASKSGGAGYLRGGVTMRDCVVRNNTSALSGGAFGFYSKDSPIETTIEGCYFYGNKATGANADGGALSMSLAGTTEVRITGSLFEDNSSVRNGGALLTSEQPTARALIVNNRFVGNSCGGHGTAYYNMDATGELINALVYNNGPGLSAVYTAGSVVNSTIVRNEGGVEASSASTRIHNSVVWGNRLGGNPAGISGGTNGFVVANSAYTVDISEQSKQAGSSDNDFLAYNEDNVFGFQLPTSFVGSAGTAEQKVELTNCDWTLNVSSRLVDKGNNGWFLTEFGSTDLVGKDRIYQNRIVDKGAYESLFSRFIPTPNEPEIPNDPVATVTLGKPAEGTAEYVVSSGAKTVLGLTIQALPNHDETKPAPVELEIRDGASLKAVEGVVVEYDFANYIDKWAFLSLPFDLDLTMGVRMLPAAESGDLERVGLAEVDYGFRIYDSEHRATGQVGNWWNVNLSGDPSKGEHTALPDGSTVLKAGTGFIFYLPSTTAERVVRFCSANETSLSSSANKEVAYYGGGRSNDAGWQLVGVPMTTGSVEMSQGGESVGVPAFVYVYNGSAYLSEPTDSYSMRPFQGYFMQVSDETNSWNFKTASGATTRSPLTCSATRSNSLPITLNMVCDGMRIDRSQIQFNDAASAGFVYNEDALKLVFNKENRIATLSGGEQFSFNQLPFVNGATGVSLTSFVQPGSECVISRLEGVTDFSSILIQDSRGGASTDLMQSDFALAEGSQHYLLTFLTMPTNLSEPHLDRPFGFFDQEMLRVVGLSGRGILYNSSGIKLWEGEVGSHPQLNLSRGVYFLRVADQEIKIVK